MPTVRSLLRAGVAGFVVSDAWLSQPKRPEHLSEASFQRYLGPAAAVITQEPRPAAKPEPQAKPKPAKAKAKAKAKAAAKDAPAKPGPFPAFKGKSAQGAPVTLSTYAGKKKLIYWYPKADTPGCTVEGKGFTDLYGQYSDLGVEVIGMSADPPAENLKFAQKFGFPFPLVSDVDRAVPKALTAAGKEPSGRWAAFVGEHGAIIRFWASVNPSEFPQNALTWMRNKPKESLVKRKGEL